MLDSFYAASTKAKLLNLTFLLLNFMAWVSCCVNFGGKMIHMTLTYSSFEGSETMGYDFYWNKVVMSGETANYGDEKCAFDACDKCNSGGKGLIAMSVFAFLGLTAVLFLTTFRILGISISAFEPTRKSLFIEWVLTLLNTLWFFLAVCAFGGTCFTELNRIKNGDVTGTGFAYLIVCFLFLVGNVVIGWILRGDVTAHLGSSASGTDYHSEQGEAHTTNYNAPATYQYNASDSQAYAGSYNGDVVPAQGGDNL